MHNCSEDILAHHDEQVTLPQPERTNMRERRDANRDRLSKGLKQNNKPAPREFVKQGSYAMKTMVQHTDKDYDIDDGVYFDKEDLFGDRGAEMSGLQARRMVRDALDDGSFKTPPEVRLNCVRAFYAAGYHVDLPVYRRVTVTDAWGNETYQYELASGEWKRSDARDVTDWFDRENTGQSPDTTNGRQLRRIVRQIKKFARSRSSWPGRILGGFGITVLVVECYRPNLSLEDTALYDTIRAIRDRLNWNLVINHPVTPNETITNGNDDAKAKFLRNRLTEAIDTLGTLFDHDCNRNKALKCWDTVFATTFFSNRGEFKKEDKAALLKAASVAPPAGTFMFPNVPRRDDKPRGFG